MINLADVMILGPFDFSKHRQHHEPDEQWKSLIDETEEYQVDAANVNRKVPLPHYKTNKTKKQK
jgi:hypothetical protein